MASGSMEEWSDWFFFFMEKPVRWWLLCHWRYYLLPPDERKAVAGKEKGMLKAREEQKQISRLPAPRWATLPRETHDRPWGQHQVLPTPLLLTELGSRPGSTRALQPEVQGTTRGRHVGLPGPRRLLRRPPLTSAPARGSRREPAAAPLS